MLHSPLKAACVCVSGSRRVGQSLTPPRRWGSRGQREGAVEVVAAVAGPVVREDSFGDGIKHKFTRPYRPQTNGKVERFNRTLTAEWAYARAWTSEGQRTRALDHWLHIYNHHRHHTAIDGPPISRVGNVTGSYT